MNKKLIFPEGFYWGAATASYQVEGGIYNNDWWKAGEEGHVPKAGMADEHYTRYESDFDLVKELGHNAHRFSVEWSRIEPEEGTFDDNEIEHYRKVLHALKLRGIEPFVTLWHFTLPLWFVEKEGFESSDAAFYFTRYCEYVTQKLKDECSHWATINEPIVFASNGWLRGNWPPFKKNNFFTFIKVTRNLAQAHNQAYKAIKKAALGSDVGIVKDNIYFCANGNPINKLKAAVMNWFWNRRILNMVHEHCDTIGLNYYFHKKFGDTDTYEKSDMGWNLFPEGLYHVLKELERYKLPVFIAECGIADETDQYRPKYIKDTVYWTHRAIEDGVDIRGFMYWSLLDNFEWALGFEKRFGLIQVNYKTQERAVTKSADVFKQICQDNALTT